MGSRGRKSWEACAIKVQASDANDREQGGYQWEEKEMDLLWMYKYLEVESEGFPDKFGLKAKEFRLFLSCTNNSGE